MPILSLLVWVAGGYLFKKEMMSPGSIETFSKVLNYGSIILVMWALLAVWIVWNQNRYGRHNRRNGNAPIVSTQQLCDKTMLTEDQIDFLRNSKEVYLHFDNEDHPIIDDNVESLDKHQRIAAV